MGTPPPAWGWGHHRHRDGTNVMGTQPPRGHSHRHGDTTTIGMPPASWGHNHCNGDTSTTIMGTQSPWGHSHQQRDTINIMGTQSPPSWGHNHQGDTVTTKGTQSPPRGHCHHHHHQRDTITTKGTPPPLEGHTTHHHWGHCHCGDTDANGDTTVRGATTLQGHCCPGSAATTGPPPRGRCRCGDTTGTPQALPWSSFSDLSKRANLRGSSTTVNFLSRALMTSLARVCERTCRCLTVPRGR